MHKVLKWFLITIVGISIIAIVLYYSGREYIENKIENKIIALCKKSNILYDSLEIDLLNNQISINGPRLAISWQNKPDNDFNWNLSDIKLSGFSYKDYLMDKKIRLKTISLNNPSITYYKNDSLEFKANEKKWKVHADTDVFIENIIIDNAFVNIINTQTDSLISQIGKLDLKISDITVRDSLSENPFEYKRIQLNVKDLLYDCGKFEQLCISEVKTDLKEFKLRDIMMKTKYPKKEYYELLEKERDWYHVTIDSLNVSQIGMIVLDSLKHYKIGTIQIYDPNIQILRNKLLPDDYDYKPLYSQMLREVDFSFEIDSLNIHNGSVTYNEKVDNSSNTAKLEFSELNGRLKNFANHFQNQESPKTQIEIDGKFMGTTPLDAFWEYNVLDESDSFLFTANIGRIDAAQFNQFIEPQINAVLSGVLKKTYFTISGTDYYSNIDMKLNYDDFKVTVFKKNSNEKNKLLSSLANLFIKKTTRREEDNFRETSKRDIRRDTSKSFFNFIWMNVREGLIIAMIGDAGQA